MARIDASLRRDQDCGRTFWVRPVSPSVLAAGNVVAAALAETLPCGIGFFFGEAGVSMNFWTVIAWIAGFDDD